MINVHIAEDIKMFVEMLVPVINNSGIARVTGFSLKLSDCRKVLASNLPDVLLLDISMRDGNGLIFCSEIHRKYPQLKIIALTVHEEYSCVMNMLENGALGYIVKSQAVSEVLEGIQAVMQGEKYISSEIEQIMRKTTREAIKLSPREMETLELTAKGLSDNRIAEQMEVALSTIHSFQKKLHLKLSVKTRFELIEKARKEGLI